MERKHNLHCALTSLLQVQDHRHAHSLQEKTRSDPKGKSHRYQPHVIYSLAEYVCVDHVAGIGRVSPTVHFELAGNPPRVWVLWWMDPSSLVSPVSWQLPGQLELPGALHEVVAEGSEEPLLHQICTVPPCCYREHVNALPAIRETRPLQVNENASSTYTRREGIWEELL